MLRAIEVNKAEGKPNPHGVDARTLSDLTYAQVVHITLQPGQGLKRHITPVDVVFYVLEGTGVVEIGDESSVVGPNTLVESPARIPHRWINESHRPLRFLVVKTPRPTEATEVI
jgi:mannose-6-phosphate isomerase-like protein (cupin superfamily)